MAKTTGLGWTTFSVGDTAGPNAATDIRNDCTSLAFTSPRGVQDVTGLDKSAMERLLTLADFTVSPAGVFNAAGAHVIFSTVPSSSQLRCVLITVAGKNFNQGSAGAGNGAVLFTDYANTRSQAGEFTWTAPGVLGNGAVPTWS